MILYFPKWKTEAAKSPDAPPTLNQIIQKVGEESIEVIIEATLKNKKRTIYESADLLYHLLIMWNRLDISLQDIAIELNRRKK